SPRPGTLVATTKGSLGRSTAVLERLGEVILPGRHGGPDQPVRTALGPVLVGRVSLPGLVEVSGPTLLRDLRRTRELLARYGARLILIDGALDRVGAAAPAVSDALILCTGGSVGGTLETVLSRTAAVLAQLRCPAAPPELARLYGELPSAVPLGGLDDTGT